MKTYKNIPVRTLPYHGPELQWYDDQFSIDPNTFKANREFYRFDHHSIATSAKLNAELMHRLYSS